MFIKSSFIAIITVNSNFHFNWPVSFTIFSCLLKRRLNTHGKRLFVSFKLLETLCENNHNITAIYSELVTSSELLKGLLNVRLLKLHNGKEEPIKSNRE